MDGFRCDVAPLISLEFWLRVRAEEEKLPLGAMYYRYPEQDAACEAPNQYEFGGKLIVCPITVPADSALGPGRPAA